MGSVKLSVVNAASILGWRLQGKEKSSVLGHVDARETFGLQDVEGLSGADDGESRLSQQARRAEGVRGSVRGEEGETRHGSFLSRSNRRAIACCYAGSLVWDGRRFD